MAALALRKDEGVGLALAGAAHIALVAFLVWQPMSKPVVLPPERMTVTISEEVGLTSTSPEPAALSAPDMAPDLGEPAPPEPEPAPPPPQARPEPPKPQPQPPQPKAVPKPPPPKPVARPAPPRPVAKPTPPPPVRKATPPPRPAPPRAQPQRPQPAAQPAARPAQARPQANPQPRPAGASRIGSDFLKGTPGAQTTGKSSNPPAAAIGPAVRASLSGAISRQLKPKWAAPQGAEADQLVTILTWTLNRDGTLASGPTVVRQEGITDANRAQAQRHSEQAVRAVRLAAPFDLPDEYYDAWKRVASFRFDKRLSQ